MSTIYFKYLKYKHIFNFTAAASHLIKNARVDIVISQYCQ